MADLTITAAEVQPDTTGKIIYGIAAEAITPGQTIYKTATGTYGLADADAAGKKTCVGISLNTAASGQTVGIQVTGTITIGSSATVAETIYVLSGTAGGIAPAADLGSGDDIVYLGAGNATNDTITLNIHNSGKAVT